MVQVTDLHYRVREDSELTELYNKIETLGNEDLQRFEAGVVLCLHTPDNRPWDIGLLYPSGTGILFSRPEFEPDATVAVYKTRQTRHADVEIAIEQAKSVLEDLLQSRQQFSASS